MNGKDVIAGLLLLVLGGVNTAFPQFTWYLRYGWHYQDAEPSDISLRWIRISGVISMVIGLVFLLKGCVGV